VKRPVFIGKKAVIDIMKFNSLKMEFLGNITKFFKGIVMPTFGLKRKLQHHTSS